MLLNFAAFATFVRFCKHSLVFLVCLWSCYVSFFSTLSLGWSLYILCLCVLSLALISEAHIRGYIYVYLTSWFAIYISWHNLLPKLALNVCQANKNKCEDKMLHFVQSLVFRHISHKIVIVEAPKTVWKTLGITMFLPSGQNCSKQFCSSTDSIVFLF